MVQQPGLQVHMYSRGPNTKYTAAHIWQQVQSAVLADDATPEVATAAAAGRYKDCP
jgi:hypothetical protein